MALFPMVTGGGTSLDLLYSTSDTYTGDDGTSSSNMVTVTGCSKYKTILVYVGQGIGPAGQNAGNMGYTSRWHVTGGTMEMIYPTTQGAGMGEYMAVLKISPTSDTITMYCTAITESKQRKFYVLGI